MKINLLNWSVIFTMDNNLKINNINFAYNKKNVLNNVSFQCKNGITALLGRNGAGKTTLMKILLGLRAPQSGFATLNDNNLLNLNSVDLKQIGYLPQNFEIFSNVIGYDFLAYICDLKNIHKHEQKAEIDNVVEKFNLNSMIKLPFGKYSGGFKRRLGIAQAVLGNPNLIVIDEPTVGLDPEQRLEFRHYLSDIGNNRITLITTHIIEDAELYSNKILMLNEGSILFDGTVNDIISSSSKSIYTTTCDLKELLKIRSLVTVIEEKRINDTDIKVKFINNDLVSIGNSIPEKEVSLENAYVYIQKQRELSR